MADKPRLVVAHRHDATAHEMLIMTNSSAMDIRHFALAQAAYFSNLPFMLFGRYAYNFTPSRMSQITKSQTKDICKLLTLLARYLPDARLLYLEWYYQLWRAGDK